MKNFNIMRNKEPLLQPIARNEMLWSNAKQLHDGIKRDRPTITAIPDDAIPPKQSLRQGNNTAADSNRRSGNVVKRTCSVRSEETSLVSRVITPLTNVSSIFSNDIIRYGAIGLAALYAYKSYRDGGIDLGDGRRRNVFVWIDVVTASMIALYIMSAAFDFS